MATASQTIVPAARDETVDWRLAAPLKLLQTELGLVMALTQIEMPLMLLPLLTVMRQIDPNLVDASRALGSSRWRTFFRVLLPLPIRMWGMMESTLDVRITAISGVLIGAILILMIMMDRLVGLTRRMAG